MQCMSHLLVFATLFVICLTDNEIHNQLTLASSKHIGKEIASTLLDAARELINKAKDLYPDCVEDDFGCGQTNQSLASLDFAMNLISEVKKRYPSCRKTNGLKHVERPIDCSDILRSGKKKSGVYTIWPRGSILTNNSINVYCDMDTDGGGWTVIQRRGNFSTPKDYFYKNWESYKKGFGNLTEEFWIGNDNIFAITNPTRFGYEARFDVKDAEGHAGYANYDSFWIENEAASYTLHIGGYRGNIGDSMDYSNKLKFSTKDRKNNPEKLLCAEITKGAWWYNGCAFANMNGQYQPGFDSYTGLSWYNWKNNWIGISGVEIKLRS